MRAGTLWCKKLHRFFIAIARTALNDDGVAGTTLHPVVWSAAANPKRRRVEQAVRNFAWLPGPAHLWVSDWSQMPVAYIGEADVAVCLFLLDFWLRWFISWVAYTGLVMLVILGWWGFLP